MKVDLRKHPPVREQVHAGLSALRAQGRQIWGATRHSLTEIAVRLTVGVGDIARVARDASVRVGDDFEPDFVAFIERVAEGRPDRDQLIRELKKELGNLIFSTVRWIDDLGFDVLECLDLAVEAQERFASSGRPR